MTTTNQPPFLTAKKLAQLKTGVVLQQSPRAVPDITIGQIILKTQNEILHCPKMKRVAATSVGRNESTNLSTAFSSKMQGDLQVLPGENRVQCLQDQSRADDNYIVIGVYGFDLVKAR